MSPRGVARLRVCLGIRAQEEEDGVQNVTKIKLVGISGVWMRGRGDALEQSAENAERDGVGVPLNCGDTFILRQLNVRLDDETDL